MLSIHLTVVQGQVTVSVTFKVIDLCKTSLFTCTHFSKKCTVETLMKPLWHQLQARLQAFHQICFIKEIL